MAVTIIGLSHTSKEEDILAIEKLVRDAGLDPSTKSGRQFAISFPGSLSRELKRQIKETWPDIVSYIGVQE